MTNKQSGFVRVFGGVLAILVSIIAIAGFANRGVDERIDNKIISHEAVFESKQQEQISGVREELSALNEKVERNYEQGRHTQELVEKLLVNE